MELNKTISVRKGEALEADVIDPIIKDHIDGLSGRPDIRQFASGHSNLTYSLTYGAGTKSERKLVLRRPPFGTIPKSGHSMIREFTVMNKLKPVYPIVPNTYFHMTADDSPLGAEFYVMEQVEGYKLEKDIPESWNFSASDNRTLCENFFDKLIDLHTVDFKAIGLGDFGKAEGYVERQIKGWNGRFEKAYTDDVEDFKDVRNWLESVMPAGEVGHAICHGDYRLDNIILNKNNPLEIDAVLDWEISALGDPLMDLGNTLAYWSQAGDPPELELLRMQPCNADGMLTREEICERYAAATGYDLSHFAFYHVYGVFRLAVILQQIYYRYYHGQTQNKDFAKFGKSVNLLGNYARSLIEKSGL